MSLRALYLKAKAEGRLCFRCSWIVSKLDWDQGHRLCSGCRDALKGVNTSDGYLPDEQESPDKTGEMD